MHNMTKGERGKIQGGERRLAPAGDCRDLAVLNIYTGNGGINRLFACLFTRK